MGISGAGLELGALRKTLLAFGTPICHIMSQSLPEKPSLNQSRHLFRAPVTSLLMIQLPKIMLIFRNHMLDYWLNFLGILSCPTQHPAFMKSRGQ